MLIKIINNKKTLVYLDLFTSEIEGVFTTSFQILIIVSHSGKKYPIMWQYHGKPKFGHEPYSILFRGFSVVRQFVHKIRLLSIFLPLIGSIMARFLFYLVNMGHALKNLLMLP